MPNRCSGCFRRCRQPDEPHQQPRAIAFCSQKGVPARPASEDDTGSERLHPGKDTIVTHSSRRTFLNSAGVGAVLVASTGVGTMTSAWSANVPKAASGVGYKAGSAVQALKRNDLFEIENRPGPGHLAVERLISRFRSAEPTSVTATPFLGNCARLWHSCPAIDFKRGQAPVRVGGASSSLVGASEWDSNVAEQSPGDHCTWPLCKSRHSGHRQALATGGFRVGCRASRSSAGRWLLLPLRITRTSNVFITRAHRVMPPST